MSSWNRTRRDYEGRRSARKLAPDERTAKHNEQTTGGDATIKTLQQRIGNRATRQFVGSGDDLVSSSRLNSTDIAREGGPHLDTRSQGTSAKQGTSNGGLSAPDGTGDRLPQPARAHYESRFGRDFGDVRIHTGTWAREAARALGANAFTLGSDIGFAEGRYQPGTSQRNPLVAHELTHVAQQSAGGEVQRYDALTTGTDRAEREASAIARSTSSPDQDSVHPTATIPPGTVARDMTATWPGTTGFLPQLPGAFAPREDEPVYDAEGHLIHQTDSGLWYLADEPSTIAHLVKEIRKPQLYPINPLASFQALKSRAEDVKAEQDGYANRLRREEDLKYWFARVYYYVTLRELQMVDAAAYYYPHMKMQLIHYFHATYSENLDAWENEAAAAVEENWRRAFASAEGASFPGLWMMSSPAAYAVRLAQALIDVLVPSIEAHVRLDLPRALATAYAHNYADIPGAELGDFQPDFFAMDRVFELATEDIRPEIEDEHIPLDGLIPSVISDTIQDEIFDRLFYLPTEREMVWEKAELILEYSGLDPSLADESLRAVIEQRHEGESPFDVAGSTVGTFDWYDQPWVQPHLPAPIVHEPAPPLPEFPRRLYFIVDRPHHDDATEAAVRSDQDIDTLDEFVAWTISVRDASIRLRAHASAEGGEEHNQELSQRRAEGVFGHLLTRGADFHHNTVRIDARGEEGAEPYDPDWRYVEIIVDSPGVAKQTTHALNPNLPPETRFDRR